MYYQQKDAYDYLATLHPLFGVLVGAFIAGFFSLRAIKKQFHFKKQKENISIFLQILNDLKSLEEFFIFDGKFCPSIEHRAPELSNLDGDGVEKISYAQREYQFRKVGNRIIENCWKIIFSNKKKTIPSLLKLCKEIKNYLCESQGTTPKLNLMITSVISNLVHPHLKIDTLVKTRDFTAKIKEFQERLELQIEAELPFLPDKK
jgi:hypothetical protein